MADNPIFDKQALAYLEQKLWRIIENRTSDTEFPPHLSSLLIADACEEHHIALAQYAWDLAHGQEDAWAQHPLLEHLAQCETCRAELQRTYDFYQRSPNSQRLSDTDIDITIFYKDITPPNKEDVLRGALGREETLLLSAGLLDDPEGWYYSLEQIRETADDGEGGLLLTLVTPEGAARGVPVTMVLLGRILQRKTDEQGQVFLAGVEVPYLDRDSTPALVLRVHLT